MQWRYNTPLERVRTSNTFSNNAIYAEHTALSIYNVLRACAEATLVKVVCIINALLMHIAHALS
jgi:hypothetical protein